MNETARAVRFPSVATPQRHWKLSADQYQRMGEVGILHEDDRVELLGGELYEMLPIGKWHNGKVNRLNRRLDRNVGERAIVQAQGSFRLSADTEPEPDILVLRFRSDFYESAPAGPEDVLLLIEVADTSLAYDRDVKLPLYARAGIPEVWIVNRDAARIEVYREPHGGVYRSVTMVERGGSVTPLAFPDLTIPVSDILG
ncbi:MAG: Uma2 family endonuclease [Dehalococcoidia bacterium]